MAHLSFYYILIQNLIRIAMKYQWAFSALQARKTNSKYKHL